MWVSKMNDESILGLFFLGIITLALFGLMYLIGWGLTWIAFEIFETTYVTSWWKRTLIGLVVMVVFGTPISIQVKR